MAVLYRMFYRIGRSPRNLRRVMMSQTVPFSRKNPRPECDVQEYDFEMEAKKVLMSIEKALEPVKAMNDKFDIVKYPNELQIDTGEKVVSFHSFCRICC